MIFLNFRTDLALEMSEMTAESGREGIISRKFTDDGIEVTEIEITDERGEKLLGKPKGVYLTIEVTPFSVGSELFSSPELAVLSKHIGRFIPEGEKTVLVAGIGNDDITADSLGPKTASLVLATRHISEEFSSRAALPEMRSVASVTTGVLGKTGIETSEIISSIVKAVKPCVLITVDALAARNLGRLGTTVQLSTGGIVPGSGVGNSRQAINEKTTGVSVLSIGVPTVVDGATFLNDILAQSGQRIPENSFPISEGDITVTPKEIDIMTQRASRLIAMGINCALHKNLSPEEIFSIVSE